MRDLLSPHNPPPLISVIIPFTENTPLIIESIQSLNSSLYTNITLHLFNESFTGSETQAISDLSRFPLRFHPLEQKDIIEELANCADSARGDYLHFLHAGIQISPNFYCVLIAELQKSPEFSFGCGALFNIEPPGVQQPKFGRDSFNDLYSYRLTSLLTQPMTLSTALIPKALYSQIGGIQEGDSLPWTYALSLRLAHALQISRHPKATISLPNDAEEFISPDSALTFLKTRGVPFFIPQLIQAEPEKCSHFVSQLTRLLIDKGHQKLARCFLLWLNNAYPDSLDAKSQSAPLFARIGEYDRAIEMVTHWKQKQPSNREADAYSHDLSPPPYKGKTREQALSILFVCHSFPPSPYAFGGTELYALHLAKELIKRGIHVAVMTPLYESLVLKPGEIRETSFQGVDLIQLRINHFISLANTLSNPKLSEKISSCVEKHCFDLVHIQYPLGIGLLAAQALTQRQQVPTLMTLHDASLFCDQGHLRQAGKIPICSGPENAKKCADCHQSGNRRSMEAVTAPELLEKLFLLRNKTVHLLLKRMQRVLVPTDFLYQYLKRFNYPLTNVSKTKLGANLFPPLPHQESQVVRFFYLGNIVSVKGVEILLEAFESIDASEAELHLYGRSFSGKLLDSLKPYFKRPNIFYRGAYKHQDLPHILQNADVGVIPSFSDNYPTVAREFLHAGVPLIASRVGGIPEIVDDGVNGVLFESGNIQDLHQQLRRAIENPEIFTAFRKAIGPIYSISDDAAQTLEIYDSILHEFPHNTAPPPPTNQPARLSRSLSAAKQH